MDNSGMDLGVFEVAAEHHIQVPIVIGFSLRF